MLGTTDLEFDEAHYWMWSERLAPAYFSKGPGIAFAIRAEHRDFRRRTNSVSAFGVRCSPPATSLLLFYFGGACSTRTPAFGR